MDCPWDAAIRPHGSEVSVMLLQDLHNACVDIAHIERGICFLDEFVVFRLHDTAAKHCAMTLLERLFFLRHKTLLPGCVSLRAMATPGGIGEIAVFPAVRKYKERISQWLTPWRKVQDSNLAAVAFAVRRSSA